MTAPSSGRKTPVDYGVQIRFIKDLDDSGGGQPGSQPRTKTQTTSKYGVAVRVQGIAGQPYVVLKDGGKKGDSYGVQLKTQYPSGYSSLPRRRDRADSGGEGGDITGAGGQGGALRRYSDLCLKVTPDLLLDQGQSSEMSNEEEQLMQAIYSILREGYGWICTQCKHRYYCLSYIYIYYLVCCSVFFNCLYVSFSPDRLTQLCMDRENAEARVREMEDQLAELQDELRRESSGKTELVSCQAELSEVCQLKQRLEETLRQRERELTALKGALKEEVATHDKEIEALREQYSRDMERLRSSMEQVSQSQAGIEAERLRVNASVRSLQQQLEDCRDESNIYISLQELQRSHADLQKVQSEVEKHRTEFDKKVMEVISLKKSHQEQEAELRYEIDRLKDQLQRTKEDFNKAQEKNKQSLQDTQQEQEEANTRLREKLSRLEVKSSEAELALHTEMRGLRSELDEAKRRASRLVQEHRDLSLRLEDREKEKETLTQLNNQLEDTKRQHERALEKLNKEYESLSASSRQEVQALRVQLEEQRDRARKETQEAQRHGNDAQAELERSHINLRRLEEEISRQKKELLLVCEERDNHQLDKELLTNRLRHLEGELETSKNSHSEKVRENRSLEDKLKRVELELEEEKSSVEMLTDRLTRSRDQIDQLRSELMQERSSKQDLELDKNALERHMKELRSRVADMEGQSRSSAGVSQLENKIQELEERLHSEEREKNSILGSQRRLERKLKELNMALDEERQQHTEQRDQLILRVKALKRQVDEGETEVDRIDGLRRKAQREMEEQMELKEASQARVTALETELNEITCWSFLVGMKTCRLSAHYGTLLYRLVEGGFKTCDSTGNEIFKVSSFFVTCRKRDARQ
uniref:Cingulin n=1 Tax=Myripristis murdjan TaxID=586833 RepID=A0A667YMG3_9TELE